MSERILMTGNEALAEAAIRAGCDAYFGYPITPQNEITAYMSKRMPEEGLVFLQSESELAAINMVYGAVATGKRAMTSSSSPGISLMQEGLSYLAGAQLPSVVVNVMRGGPGLGNISPSQGDYFQSTRGGGHGDYRTIVLAPCSVQEMVDFMPAAFDLADRYRMTVLIVADGILGQMMEPVSFENVKAIKPPDKPWALTGVKNREQNIVRSLFLGEGALEGLNYELQKKYRQIERNESRCEEHDIEGAEIIIVAFGIAARIIRPAIARARKEGTKIGWIRPITLWPFPYERIKKSVEKSGSPNLTYLCVEMNLGQMVEDVKLALEGKAAVRFYGRPGGEILTVEEVYEQIKKIAKENAT